MIFMFSSLNLISFQWWITSSRGWFWWKRFGKWVWQKCESWIYWNMGWIWKVQPCIQLKHSNNHAKVVCLLLICYHFALLFPWLKCFYICAYLSCSLGWFISHPIKIGRCNSIWYAFKIGKLVSLYKEFKYVILSKKLCW